MKTHIPNILTLANLLFGTIGIIELLVFNNVSLACYCMIISLVCDFFDGFVARLLGVGSALGKELDSLADMVTFGVLPGLMYYQILINYTGFSKSLALLGLGIPLFSALRLAKFNIDTRQADSFIGVPTPANAIFIAAIAFNLENNLFDWLGGQLTSTYFALFVLVMSCIWMVAEVPLLAFKFKQFAWRGNEIRYGFLIFVVLMISLFKTQALPWVILTYFLVSVIANRFKKPRY